MPFNEYMVIRVSAASCIRLWLPNCGYVVELNKRCFFKERRNVITPLGGGLRAHTKGVKIVTALGGQFEREADTEGADLRFRIPIEQLHEFRSWFHRRMDTERECSGLREFTEEVEDEHNIKISGNLDEAWVGCREYFAMSDHAKQEPIKTFYIQEIYEIQLSQHDSTLIESRCNNFHSMPASASNRLLALQGRELHMPIGPQNSTIAQGCSSLRNFSID